MIERISCFPGVGLGQGACLDQWDGNGKAKASRRNVFFMFSGASLSFQRRTCLWQLLFQGEYGVTWNESESSPNLELTSAVLQPEAELSQPEHRPVSEKNRRLLLEAIEC